MLQNGTVADNEDSAWVAENGEDFLPVSSEPTVLIPFGTPQNVSLLVNFTSIESGMEYDHLSINFVLNALVTIGPNFYWVGVFIDGSLDLA